MKKIERPSWDHMFNHYKNSNTPYWGMDTWFAHNIENRYIVDESDLIKLYSNKRQEPTHFWSTNLTQGIDTHSAYLIKSSLESIKKESAADVLRDFVKEYSNRYGKSCEPELLGLKDRAKAVLGES